MKITYKGRFSWDDGDDDFFIIENEYNTITEWLQDSNVPLYEMTLDEYAEDLHRTYEEQKLLNDKERDLYITPDNWYEIYLKEKDAKLHPMEGIRMGKNEFFVSKVINGDINWEPGATLRQIPSGVFGTARVISEYTKLELLSKMASDNDTRGCEKENISIPSDMKEDCEKYVRVRVPFISENPYDYMDEEKCRNAESVAFILGPVNGKYLEAGLSDNVQGMPMMGGYNLLFVAAYVLYLNRFVSSYEFEDQRSKHKQWTYINEQLFAPERNAAILDKTFLRCNWSSDDYRMTRDYVEEGNEIIMPDTDYGDIEHRTEPVKVYVHDTSKESRFSYNQTFPSVKEVVLGTPLEILAGIDDCTTFAEDKVHYAIIYDILNKAGAGQRLYDTVYTNTKAGYDKYDKKAKTERIKRRRFSQISKEELMQSVEKQFVQPGDLWMLKDNRIEGLRGFVTAETADMAADAAYPLMELLRRKKDDPFSRVVELEYVNSLYDNRTRNGNWAKVGVQGSDRYLKLLGDTQTCFYDEYVFENQNLYILPVGAINGENVYEDATVQDVETIVNAMEAYGDNLSVLIIGKESDILNLIKGSEKIKYYFTDGIFEVVKTKQDNLYREILSRLPAEKQRDPKFRKELREYVRKTLNEERMDADLFTRSLLRNMDVAALTGKESGFKLEQPVKDTTAAEELNSLIGLKSFKKELREYRASLEFQGNRTIKQKRSGKNYHMIFMGEPGTGKTKCGRIMAKVLYEVGVLPTKKILEIGGNDLTTPYAVEKYVKEAMGGVLFIDEAYTLAYSFGAYDIVTELIRQMENHRDEVVVILCGYEKGMKDLISINEGFFSRIGKTFHFENYTPEELLEIFKLKAKTDGISVSKEAEGPLIEVMSGYSYTPNFGNGRFAEKLLVYAEDKHAIRIKKEKVKKDDPLYYTLLEQDIPSMNELVSREPNLKLNMDVNDTRSGEEILTSLIGLSNVKQEVSNFKAYAAFTRAGIDKEARKTMNFHMAFLGNPGTDKTEVARAMARILHETGVLPTARFTELNGAGLGRPDIISEMAKTARGGVLFIDEAYSIKSPEVVTALITEMENNRDCLVVIMAGYEEEMKQFFKINPGFSSRVRYTFHFEDYKPEELTEIFKIKAKKHGLTLDKGGEEAVLGVMSGYSYTPNFGNGRFAETLVQYAEMKHATRMVDEGKGPRHRGYKVLSREDIPSVPEVMEKETNRRVNKKLDKFKTSEELISDLVGLEQLKKEIEDFRAYAKFAGNIKNGSVRESTNFHMAFLGNPGTGKTEVARIMAKILHEAGILPTEGFREVSRVDMVAGYVGQTAQKVKKCVQEAMGGLLFIDEAYSICRSEQDDFGQEAVDTLIKEMEDNKDKLVVIFAGYEKEMASFFKSNSGLSSRIGYTFRFENYTAQELTEIYRLRAAEKGLTVSSEAEERILAIMEKFRSFPNFGNGRFAGNVMTYTLTNHAKRVVDLEGTPDYMVITAEDVPSVSEIIEKNPEKNSMWDPSKVSEESIKLTAYHEAGHAICSRALCGSNSMKSISVVGEVNGTAGAVSVNTAELGAKGLLNTPFMFGMLVTFFGGKCAEEEVYGSHTTGCVSDIAGAKSFASDMVSKYAMPYMATDEDALVKELISKADLKAQELLSANRGVLDRLAAILFEKKSLKEEEIDDFFAGEVLEKADNPYGQLPDFML